MASVKECAIPSRSYLRAEMVVKHKPLSGKQITIRPQAVIRLLVAFALLLTLLGTNISWSALGNAHLCTLACCAGKAPHTAGSCMHASCDSASLKGTSAHGQHHHVVAPVDSDAPAGFAGAIASVGGGAGIDDVPTIDVSNDQNPQMDSTAQHLPAVDAMSVACPSECGACSAAFSPNKRPRIAVVGAGAHKNFAPPVAPTAARPFPTIDLRRAFVETATPRGPPGFLANSHS